MLNQSPKTKVHRRVRPTKCQWRLQLREEVAEVAAHVAVAAVEAGAEVGAEEAVQGEEPQEEHLLRVEGPPAILPWFHLQKRTMVMKPQPIKTRQEVALDYHLNHPTTNRWVSLSILTWRTRLKTTVKITTMLKHCEISRSRRPRIARRCMATMTYQIQHQTLT
jgi:hypothetical protein